MTQWNKFPEQELLWEYVADGGKLMVYAGPLEDVNAIVLK